MSMKKGKENKNNKEETINVTDSKADPGKTVKCETVKCAPVKYKAEKWEPVECLPIEFGVQVKSEPTYDGHVSHEVKLETEVCGPVKCEPVKSDPVNTEPEKGETIKQEVNSEPTDNKEPLVHNNENYPDETTSDTDSKADHGKSANASEVCITIYETESKADHGKSVDASEDCTLIYEPVVCQIVMCDPEEGETIKQEFNSEPTYDKEPVDHHNEDYHDETTSDTDSKDDHGKSADASEDCILICKPVVCEPENGEIIKQEVNSEPTRDKEPVAHPNENYYDETTINKDSKADHGKSTDASEECIIIYEPVMYEPEKYETIKQEVNSEPAHDKEPVTQPNENYHDETISDTDSKADHGKSADTSEDCIIICVPVVCEPEKGETIKQQVNSEPTHDKEPVAHPNEDYHDETTSNKDSKADHGKSTDECEDCIII